MCGIHSLVNTILIVSIILVNLKNWKHIYIYILFLVWTNAHVFLAQSERHTLATLFTHKYIYLELDLNRAMDHPIIHRLLRTSFQSWKRDNEGSWSPPAFLDTYFITMSLISSFFDYVNALDSSMPFVAIVPNLQELVSLLSFELVQWLGDPFSAPVFQNEDPDEGWWMESTRVQLERFLIGYIRLFNIQDDLEKTKMTKHVKAIKSHLEYCIRVSNDELWGDLFQWSTSLVSLNETHRMGRASVPASRSAVIWNFHIRWLLWMHTWNAPLVKGKMDSDGFI